MTSGVAERIARLVEPIRADIAALDVEIAAVESRLDGLKADRRQLNAVLRATQPKPPAAKPGPKPKTGASYLPPSEAALESVRAFIRGLDADGQAQIVAGTLARDIELAANGSTDYPRKDTVRRAIHTMHERGELRLKRTRTVGGGLVYSYLGG